MDHSVIFVNSPEKNFKSPGLKTVLKDLFYVAPNDLLFRIWASFVPPLGKKYKKIYIDFLGPTLAFLILTAFVTYGHAAKTIKTGISPAETLCTFLILMPAMCVCLSKMGRSTITLCETISLVGYALFGHLFTLLFSFVCFQERSNFFFFVCLIFFGGFSTLRLTLVILGTIPTPPARLLVCTVISIVNLLFLVFLHFAFMHKTFIYAGA